jgi:hypothetical protein
LRCYTGHVGEDTTGNNRRKRVIRGCDVKDASARALHDNRELELRVRNGVGREDADFLS